MAGPMTSHPAGMRFLGAWVCLALASTGLAQAAETAETADGHARVTLLADVEAVPAGEPFRLGVRFQLDPEWHMYWHNPGQAGLATELEWKSDVVTVGPTQWPAPRRFATADDFIVTHGYENDVLLFAEAKARASGDVEVRIDFLVCKTDCIPGQAVLSHKIDVAQGRWVANEALFEAAAAEVPRSQATPSRYELRQEQQRVTAEVTYPAAGLALLEDPRGSFFVHRVPGLELVVKRGETRDDAVHLVLEGTAKMPLPDVIPAVLVLRDAKGTRQAFEITFEGPPPVAAAVAAAPPVITETPPPAAVSLVSVLWLAFLGGMILNLMPCVLPVLALKVSGLARMAGESRRARGSHAIAFLGGIQVALLALGAIVLGLRLAGTQVGWGFQFQQPIFLAIMGGLLVVLAMNAFGVFELDVGGVANDLAEKVDGTSGLRKSFGEGALAVVLATPCSAPFVGSAIGYALTAPAYVVFAVFAMLGLGLWLPFAMLAMAPGAKRILPKPGRWMLALKQGVGFTLLGAALWILWVAARAAGVDGAGRIGLFWLALAVGGWIVGFVQTRRLVALVAVGVAAIGIGVATLRFDAEPVTETVADGWRPWSEEVVAQHLADGKTVFVDFTADWCITCKVNERTAIADDQVKALVASRDITMLRADWTRPDDRIRAALTKHGRAGVPMYLVYSPDRPGAPDVLPEVLTPGIVHDALDRASRTE
jgi:thiol:disulfide interchange protein/DsbC/DsbD-like thiol-disulfide interchange protein